jgi:TRAP transporter TAXI family solute receptor
MLTSRKMLFIAVLSILSAFISLSIMESRAAELPKALSIGTHPKGSSFNAIGSGIAKVISLHTPITAVDRPFAGYSKWLPLLNKGGVDLGIVGNVDSYSAYHGLTPFKEPNKNLRMLTSGNDVVLSYIVRSGSGIKTYADFKNKRVIIDPTGAGTGGIQKVLISAAGLDLHKDIKAIPVAGVTEAVDALIDGRADAAWASVGMGKVKEAIQKVKGIYWVPVCSSPDANDGKIIRKELEAQGVELKYFEPGVLSTLDNSAWLVTYPVNLATHKGLNEEAAYLIVKAIWNNQNELSPIHPMLKGWVKKMVSKNIVFPYHPGAVRFYKEVGAWSNEMEQLQQKLSNR